MITADKRKVASRCVWAAGLCAAILIIVSMLAAESAFAADDYPEQYKSAEKGTVTDEWGFPNRDCTSFAAWCLNSRNGVAFNNTYGGITWGSADNWYSAALSAGIKVDEKPAVGSIAWFSIGHVGWVSAVVGNDVTVESYDWNSDGMYMASTMDKSAVNGFIHVKDKCINHVWDKGKITKKVKHTKTVLVNGEKTYTCTICGATKKEVIKAKHSFTITKKKKATLKKNGANIHECSKCGKQKKETIYRPKTLKLKTTKVVYNGKKFKPAVTVKDSKGKKIAKKYYTVKYSSNKNVGMAKAVVKFKGIYSGSKTLKFHIFPKGTSISKVTAGCGKITVKWKKQPKQITGFQVQAATDKNFKKNRKAKTVNGKNSVEFTIEGLKESTSYYVRVRAFKKVGKKKFHSEWSKLKHVKTLSVKDLYKPVISEYKKVIKSIESGSGFNSNYKGYKYVSQQVVLALYNDDIDPEYSIKDINGDGIKEFVVGGRNYGSRYLGSILTLTKSDKPKKLIDCSSYMYRATLNAYTNGVIEHEGSGGAGYHDWRFYKINGKKAKLVGTDRYIFDDSAQKQYTHNGKGMSKDAFNSQVKKKESKKKMTFKWKKFV